jgi:YjbE family integral membrane protein
MDFFLDLLKIIMVNIVLSGDNAVVIALASRNLPEAQRKMAVMWGGGGAIVLRVILTVVAVVLLKIPFLQFIGGLLLLWIAYQLLVEEDEGEGEQAHSSFWPAVKTIIIADIVMSLDNTLAIAAVAKDSYLLLGLGLAISVPLIVLGSQLILKIMDRFPVIVYIGAGLIAWTAGEMIESDKKIAPYIEHFHRALEHVAMPLLVTAVVVGAGLYYNLRRQRTAADVLRSGEHAAERFADRNE